MMSVLPITRTDAAAFSASGGRPSAPARLSLAFPLVALALVTLGLLLLYSIGRGHPLGPHHFLSRQALWVGLGGVVFVLASRLDLSSLRRYSVLAFVCALVLLSLVLVPVLGREVNGARRWIPLGPMTLQVVDVAKFGLILFLADLLDRARQRNGRHALPCASVAGVALMVFAGLLLLQPDYGSAALCGGVGFAMAFLAGLRITWLLPPVISCAAGFGVLVYRSPERWGRITAFLDVEAHRDGQAYQLWQGLLGFSEGGFWGVGLGQGRQQLAYLPEAHTDFVFAILGEEFGLLATLGVLGLFALLGVAGVQLLARAPNRFEALVVAGCLLLILLQAVINMGVATGSLPTKGLPLPFVSYGGSNLLASAACAGLLAGAARRWGQPAAIHAREVEA